MASSDENPSAPVTPVPPKTTAPSSAVSLPPGAALPTSDASFLEDARRQIDAMNALASSTEPSSSLRLIQRHIEESERLAKLWEPSPAVKAIQEAQERADQMNRLMGGESLYGIVDTNAASSRWALGGAQESGILAEAQRYMDAARMHEAADGFVSRHQLQLASTSAIDFRLPAVLKAEDVFQSTSYGSVTAWVKGQQAQQASIMAAFEQERLRAESITRSIAGIDTPWLKLGQEHASLRAMVELSSIGTALKYVHPFDPGFTEALRQDFGDWRDAPVPDPSVWLRPDTRSDYYAARGFNRQLTNFPDKAFAEGLFAAELCDDYLADLEISEQIPEADAKTEASIRRSGECHKAITRLEMELRTFIDRLLSAKYGPDWVREVVHVDVQKKWAEKQAKAATSGFPITRLIDASDFTDYENIICRRDVFDGVFRPYFRTRESVKESFTRLGVRRVATAHARLVSNDDVLLVVAEVRRLVVAMLYAPTS